MIIIINLLPTQATPTGASICESVMAGSGTVVIAVRTDLTAWASTHDDKLLISSLGSLSNFVQAPQTRAHLCECLCQCNGRLWHCGHRGAHGLDSVAIKHASLSPEVEDLVQTCEHLHKVQQQRNELTAGCLLQCSNNAMSSQQSVLSGARAPAQ